MTPVPTRALWPRRWGNWSWNFLRQRAVIYGHRRPQTQEISRRGEGSNRYCRNMTACEAARDFNLAVQRCLWPAICSLCVFALLCQTFPEFFFCWLPVMQRFICFHLFCLTLVFPDSTHSPRVHVELTHIQRSFSLAGEHLLACQG